MLDAFLAQDPQSRVACETLTKTGFVCVAGEITSQARVKIPHVIRQAVLDIGYGDAPLGLDGAGRGIPVARAVP